jgi:1-acyl-sn-glycerol-3-phosphate acyltransferase
MFNTLPENIKNFDKLWYARQGGKVRRILNRLVGDVNATWLEEGSGEHRMYVANHRSHLDYLIIPLQFQILGRRPPAIIAGDNLTEMPVLGRQLKKMKAIPVSRELKGDRNYLRGFRDTIQNITFCGHDILLFIEGGRSYGGNIGKSKAGVVLEGIIRAEKKRFDFDSRIDSIQIVPLAISYDAVVEAEVFPRLQEIKDVGRGAGGFAARRNRWAYYGADLGVFLKHWRRQDLKGEVYICEGEPMNLRDYLDGGGTKQSLGEELIHLIRTIYHTTNTERAAHAVMDGQRGPQEGIDWLQRIGALDNTDGDIILDQDLVDYYARGHIDRATALVDYGEWLVSHGRREDAYLLFTEATKINPSLVDRIDRVF